MSLNKKVYQYAEPNLTLVGWMGFLGYPVYYIVWTFIYPQPYENITLRFFCSLLFLGIAFRDRVPAKWQEYLPLYYQVTVTIGLPFFFFYMMLMNDWSNIWIQSFMAATFLHILSVHITRVMFAQTFIAIGLATLSAWIAKGFYLEISMDWANLPIFLFIYLFGNLFYVRHQIESELRISLAKSFGAGIAHEMRNPLSSLLMSVDVIQSILPNPKSGKEKEYLLSNEDITQLREISEDAINIIHSGNETIDLLLTSIDENRISSSTFKQHYVKETIEKSIESFSYKRSIDRLSISLKDNEDFEFFGSDTLLKYVMYNLFKNAFYHRKSERFHIQVKMYSDECGNKISVQDNGSGIAPEVQSNIFKDFYTTGKSGSFGLGLPFCNKVMRAFGGSISCESELGEWTRFTLTFPLLDSNEIKNIKYELTKLKSVTFVSESESLISKIKNDARTMRFQLEILSIDELLSRKEYELERDLIFIDMDSLKFKENHLDKIESLLSFTEARIVYLLGKSKCQNSSSMSYEPIYLENNVWLSNSQKILEQLFYEERCVISVVKCHDLTSMRRRTIMVVDDNESLRKYTSILLEKQGFEVIQKEDGFQALLALDNSNVDLIVMDIEMPVMDGIEASYQIRNSEKDYSSIPIIAHTGDSSPIMLDKINLCGMSDFIVKPINKERLTDKISDWI